jgi:hypothetical protein
MKTLTETLNEFYGCKPTMFSQRDWELETFEKILKALPFKPQGFVVISNETFPNLTVDYFFDWMADNVKGEFHRLTSPAFTDIAMVMVFEDLSEAAIFKLTWC